MADSHDFENPSFKALNKVNMSASVIPFIQQCIQLNAKPPNMQFNC